MTADEPLNLDDFEARARARLPPEVWDYYAGGAGDEQTLRWNRDAWSRLALRPRVLRGAEAPALATRVLGHDLRLPVLVAPTAFQGLAHPEGEVATARAAAEAGVVHVQSLLSSRPLEDVVRAAPGRVFFQLYPLRSRKLTEALIERAEAAGCGALVVTVDTPRPGRRERDLRHGLRLPLAEALGHVLPEPLRGLRDELGAAAFEGLLDPALTWSGLEHLRARTSLPLVVKGVLRGDDARLAVEHGAAAVVVSNHGGRQLDGAPATADVLAEVVDDLAGRAEAWVDGGLRRGTDVVKALALGARAVLIGRPALWGLACDGQRGVARVLALLRDEIALTLTLCGAASAAELSRHDVRRA
jgi:4-hydroxymandelate oxidase